MALVVNNPAANAGDVGSIPGVGRSLGGGQGNPLQYSCLENPVDRGAWRATVHSVAKGRTQLKLLSMQADINATGKRLGKTRYFCIWMESINICTVYIFSSFVHWKELEIMTNPEAMSIPSTETMVLKNHFPLEEIWDSWEMADFRSEARNVQDKSGIFFILDGKEVIKDHSVSQFSHSVMSSSLRSHELQHARPPCPSPTPGVHSNSRPLSWWCHPAISSSVFPFSSCP